MALATRTRASDARINIARRGMSCIPAANFAEKLGDNPIEPEKYIKSLTIFYETGKVVKPKKPATAIGVEQDNDDEDNDEIPTEHP
jgi:hypothetical protein